MKKQFHITLLSLATLALSACQSAPKPEALTDPLSVDAIEIPALPQALTVNGNAITYDTKSMKHVGDKLITNTPLTLPTATFDTMKTTSLDHFSGWKIISTVPSLDTPVCSMQTIQIEAAAKQYSDVNFITISADLPFALFRFCGANNIKNISLVSDYLTRDFARENNLLMEEYQLLARTIMVVDTENTIRYIEYADEVTGQISVNNAVTFWAQNNDK